MTVTVCFLTRNHGECLGQAIRSVPRELANVLVADTGSTDDTLAVAIAAGAAPMQIPWADDFSQACNQTLAAVTTDWVLWLNPDEQLSETAAEALRAAMEDPKLFAARLPVRQLFRADPTYPFTIGWELRLFRKTPEVRYLGRVHPRFEPPMEELARQRMGQVRQVAAGIDRHAYRNVLTPHKIHWVIRLLEAELKDRPGQLGLEIELGRNLLLVEDSRGHELLGECARRLLLHRDAAVSPDPMVGQLLEYLLNVSGELARGPLSKEDARELGLRWFPTTPPVLWAIAAERFQAEDFAAAVEPLGRLVELGRSATYDSAGGFDPDIIGPTPLLNLGICYLRLGNSVAAKVCFAQLVGHPVHGERAQRLYAHCETLGA